MLGVARVVVAVNKMDTVGWSQERFESIQHELRALLSGYIRYAAGTRDQPGVMFADRSSLATAGLWSNSCRCRACTVPTWPARPMATTWAGGRARRSSKPWMRPDHPSPTPSISPCASRFGCAPTFLTPFERDRFRSFFRSFDLTGPTTTQEVLRVGGGVGSVVMGRVASGVVRAGVLVSFAHSGLTSSIKALEVLLRTHMTHIHCSASGPDPEWCAGGQRWSAGARGGGQHRVLADHPTHDHDR